MRFIWIFMLLSAMNWIRYSEAEVLCTNNFTVYTSVGKTTDLALEVNSSYFSGLSTFKFQKDGENDSLFVILFMDFTLDKIFSIRDGVSFVGNLSAGNLSIRISNVSRQYAGHYILERYSKRIICGTLYILGKPGKPNITSDGIKNEGAKASFTCRSYSTTTPDVPKSSLEYIWIINHTDNPILDRYIYRNDVFEIVKLNRTDTNTKVACKAKEERDPDNVESDSSEILNLLVYYGPDDFSTSLKPPSVNYTQNEYTSLNNITCSGICVPYCEYTWTKANNSGNLESTNGILSLRNLTRNAAGLYTCTIVNEKSRLSTTVSVRLDVRYGPDNESAELVPEKDAYTQNENTTLGIIKCQGKCFPECLYKWTKSGNNEPLPTQEILNLGNLKRDEAGLYTCTITNSVTSRYATKSVMISVRYGPDVCLVNSASSLTITEGYYVKDIVCKAQCFPSCTCEWKMANSLESPTTSNVLSFGHIVRNKTGTYTCTCANTYKQLGSANANIDVTVEYPPDVFLRKSSSDFVEGKKLTLTCEADGVPNTYTFHKFEQKFDETIIPNSNIETQKQNLSFTKLQLQDTGIYTCFAENGVEDNKNNVMQKSDQLNITVQTSPRILLEDQNSRFAGDTNGSILVKLPFYSLSNLTHFAVERSDGTVVNNLPNYNILVHPTVVNTTFYGAHVQLNGWELSLEIEKLGEEDVGNYSVLLVNTINSTNHQIQIVASGIPDRPSNFTYLNEDSTSSFQWKKGFNGGRIQNFVIQTEEQSEIGNDTWRTKLSVQENGQYNIGNNMYRVNIFLTPGTYQARIIANNSFGSAAPVYLKESFVVIKQETITSEPFPVVAVASSISTVILLALFVTVGVVIFKRRLSSKGQRRTRSKEWSQERITANDDCSEDEGMTENPMYGSSPAKGPIDTVYAFPKKKCAKAGTGELYAEVSKQPKKDKQKNQQKQNNADVYENGPTSSTMSNAAYEENPYENPESTNQLQTSKNVNKDGLVYADLTFNSQAKGQKKLVIHGLDNMTTYMEVDFTKKADPLPESDTEANDNK